MSDIGDWIKAERLKRGWSQDELAFRAHVPARNIGGYERDEYEPSIETAGRIIMAFELELPWAKGRLLESEIFHEELLAV
jgi:transcriptional regulator with XRE-family HTH domain